ncbi:MAG: hypothetical protein ABSC33_17620 [Candidatus Sulfotelmatobacter sp.]
MKCRIALACALVASFTCLASAQNSKTEMSTGKSRPDSLSNATKPLTPKSAITPHHSSGQAPGGSASNNKQNAELTALERQKITSTTPTSPRPSPVKSVTPKPASTPATSGSGINAPYQKPRVGQRN